MLQLRPHLDPISGEGRSTSGQRAGWVGVCAGRLPGELQLSSYQPGVGMRATRWACLGPRQLTSSGKICELLLSVRHGPRHWGSLGELDTDSSGVAEHIS